MTGARYPRTILASVGIPWSEGWEVQEDLLRDEIRAHLDAGIRAWLPATAGHG